MREFYYIRAMLVYWYFYIIKLIILNRAYQGYIYSNLPFINDIHNKKDFSRFEYYKVKTAFKGYLSKTKRIPLKDVKLNFKSVILNQCAKS